MPTTFERIQAAFLAAADIRDPAERAGFLDKACEGDLELKSRVEALLRAHDQPDSLLDHPAVASPKPGHGSPREFPAPGSALDAADTRTIGHESGSVGDNEVPLGFLEPTTRPDSLGRIGHYEVLQVLGQGGFGIVFRAFDDVLQRVVAVKVLSQQIAATSPARKRFLREARSSAAVRHENVVQVYEVGESPLPYLVMEFIPGETLQQRLDRTGPLDVAEVLGIGRQIAEGLVAAHATDLIHRDIKPANVLIEGVQLRAKITDFGLARAADDASISQSGLVAGTPLYMAPEQARGESLDHRADLFSLGSVLYVMLTGRPPFRAAGTMAVLKRVCDESPRPIREVIPEVPDGLCRIVERLHAKDPAERFQTAREVADVLADCEKQLQSHQELKDFARISEVQAKPRRSGRGRKWAAAALVMLSLPLVVLGVSLFSQPAKQPVDAPRSAEPVAIPPDPIAEGWVPLFNGKDLTEWSSDRPGAWNVSDGAITGSGWLTHLYTERGDYGDFHLRAEVKINAEGNSGIYFRTGKPLAYIGDYEAQISTTSDLFHKTGAFFGLHPFTKLIVPPDTWFTYEIVARDNHLRLLVNGTQTSEYLDARPGRRTRGHIALQHTDATQVHFRKIEIKELPSSRSAAPPPAVAPFDAAKAKEYQDAWANHLGVKAEFENTAGMKFRLIPPGEFQMGYSKEQIDKLVPEMEAEWEKDFIRRTVARPVRIAEPFYLGTCEVTVGQFRKFAEAKNYRTTAERDGKGGQRFDPEQKKLVHDPDAIWSKKWPELTNDSPVGFVTLEDAEAFCAWLTEVDGRRYAVPREEQWEYACRAGTTTLWWTGDSAEVLLRAEVLGDGMPQPVGSFKANPFGLYDMHGNLLEWVGSAGRVGRRGGFSRSSPRRTHSAFHQGGPATLADGATGFRVAIVGDLKPRGPFVVIAGDGAERRTAHNLSDAIGSARPGDAIEIRGNGPFPIKPLTLEKPLVIRAGEGFRPVLELDPAVRALNQPLFEVQAALVLEGLEIRWDGTGEQWNAMFYVAHSVTTFVLRHCRVLCVGDRRASALIGSPPRLEVRNSVVIARENAFQWNPTSSDMAVLVDRSVLCGQTGFGVHVWSESPGKSSLTIRNSTIVGRRAGMSLHWGGGGKSPPKGDTPPAVAVDAFGSILYGRTGFFGLGLGHGKEDAGELTDFLSCWTWTSAPFLVGSGQQFLWNNQTGKPATGVKAYRLPEDWKAPWKSDAVPLVGEPKFEGGDVTAMTVESQSVLSPTAFRLAKDSPGKGKGASGRDLGADVDRVGPGEPYENWRKTPDYAAWRKEVATLIAGVAPPQPNLAPDPRPKP